MQERGYRRTWLWLESEGEKDGCGWRVRVRRVVVVGE